MLEFRFCGVLCRVSLLFPALLTTLLLCDPNTLMVTCLLASVMHEGGHILAMLLLRVPPRECRVGLFGLRIELGQHLYAYKRNVVIALAGPLVNGIAAILLQWLGASQAAMVHCLLAVLNLLPVAALDGGEILRCVLCTWLSEDRMRIVLWVTSLLMILPIITVGAWAVGRGNPTLLVVGVYLALMVFFWQKNEKIS